MPSSCTLPARRLAIAAAACAALLSVAVPSATAAPTTDDLGFVDSTARCTAPDTAAAFGSTASSRVAICATSGGQYTYRGVRLRDGAKLIVPATRSDDGGYTAENDGITYLVTASSLVVSAGSEVIREEPMTTFNGAGASAIPPPAPPEEPLPPPLPAEVGG